MSAAKPITVKVSNLESQIIALKAIYCCIDCICPCVRATTGNNTTLGSLDNPRRLVGVLIGNNIYLDIYTARFRRMRWTQYRRRRWLRGRGQRSCITCRGRGCRRSGSRCRIKRRRGREHSGISCWLCSRLSCAWHRGRNIRRVDNRSRN